MAVHGYITGSVSRVDDDDIFGWEVHFRAVCLSGFPNWPRNDVGASCGKVKKSRTCEHTWAHLWTNSQRQAGLFFSLPNLWHSLTQPDVSLAVEFQESPDRDWLGHMLEPRHRQKNLWFLITIVEIIIWTERKRLLIVQRHGHFIQKTKYAYLLDYVLQMYAGVCTYVTGQYAEISCLSTWSCVYGNNSKYMKNYTNAKNIIIEDSIHLKARNTLFRDLQFLKKPNKKHPWVQGKVHSSREVD